MFTFVYVVACVCVFLSSVCACDRYIKNRFWRHWPPLVLILLVVFMIVTFGIWPWISRVLRVRILGYAEHEILRKKK